MRDEPYVNDHQNHTVEKLHRRTKHTAVVACGNSEIDVYLTRSSISDVGPELGKYEIKAVVPMPDSDEFACKVKLRAESTEESNEKFMGTEESP